MADDQQGDRPEACWTVNLDQVERLDREEGDEGETFFSVEFELSGLGVSGMLSTLIVDPADVSSIITTALDQLQDGLETFLRVLGRRKGAERIEPTDT